MRETLVVVGLLVLALGLRSSRKNHARKLGALVFLIAGFFFGYFVFNHWAGGMLGVIPWFFLPWVELLTRVRRMRLPMKNRLRHRAAPDPDFFPKAPEAAMALAEEGFEHVDDCGWEWSGMQQYFQIYWNAEERAEAAICLCEQENVAFAFLTLTSRDKHGNIWRTTNFPFSPTLKAPPHVRWNHVPCERDCFHLLLADHRQFLARIKVAPEAVQTPDPDMIEAAIEAEMQAQIRHNLESGIIRKVDDGHFAYSRRGLLFLWGQYVKDMVRLC